MKRKPKPCRARWTTLDALRADECLREGFGSAFVDYFCKLKQAEIDRFNLEVTEWEHREYFDVF